MRFILPPLRLLSADNAPLIIGFLYQVFIKPNRRSLPYGDAVSLLEEDLYPLREVHGEVRYPRSARQYLGDWSGGQTPYLRKYYPERGEEPEFDLTPATERAKEWIQGLEKRQFVGTESRLLSVFALLREIVHHTEADPECRIQDLERHKAQIDAEIERLGGHRGAPGSHPRQGALVPGGGDRPQAAGRLPRPGPRDPRAHRHQRQGQPAHPGADPGHRETRRGALGGLPGAGAKRSDRAEWAFEQGWPQERIVVIDEDHGKSSATAKTRPGFARLLGADLSAIWEAPTTTNRDRKRLLRCLIEEVQLRAEPTHHAVRIVWKGGAVTEREVVRGKPGWAQRTPEDTIALVRALARDFDDAHIARILNKQGRRSGLGHPFTQPSVTSLRGKHDIAKCPHKNAQDPIEGPFTADEAARELGVTTSTVHRWLREGVLAGEQLTPGAPWRIVLCTAVRQRLSGGEAPEDWVGLSEAARRCPSPTFPIGSRPASSTPCRPPWASAAAGESKSIQPLVADRAVFLTQ
jgi:hypothetical protein